MQSVYMVPGFLGTELFRERALRTRLWAEPGLLVLGAEGEMRLAADGISPGPPDGRPMFLGAPTPLVWNETAATVQAQLGAAAWAVKLHPWDWRTEIAIAGKALAERIIADASNVSDATIVGHSAGGLVSYFAWVELFNQGKTALVRRIVTLGTPFQGSYYPTLILSHNEDSIQQLLDWNRNATGLMAALTNPVPVVSWDWESLFTLWATFPSFAELLPGLWGNTFAGDPNRTALYDAAKYPQGAKASQKWLDFTRLSFQQDLADPVFHPPAAVLTCVGGLGTLTRSHLNTPENFRDPFSYGATGDGDGVVTLQSALYGPCAIASATCEHSSMPLSLSASGDITRWILDRRVPPAPPPPPQAILAPFPEVVTATPPTEMVTGLQCIGGG